MGVRAQLEDEGVRFRGVVLIVVFIDQYNVVCFLNRESNIKIAISFNQVMALPKILSSTINISFTRRHV